MNDKMIDGQVPAEFVDEVKSCFAKYGYTQEAIDAYFSESDTLDILRTNYEGYIAGLNTCSPEATAHSLYMLY